MMSHRQRMGEKKSRRENAAVKMEKAARTLLEIHTSLMDPELGDIPTDFIALSEFCSATAAVFKKKAEEFMVERLQVLDDRYQHGARISDAIKRGESY